MAEFVEVFKTHKDPYNGLTVRSLDNFGLFKSIVSFETKLKGAAGLVLNENGDVLLMKEKRGHYLGWKFPGGLADPGEDLYVAAEREVKEETGISCDTQSVVAFRHLHKFRYPECSDFYFVCKMRPTPGSSTEPEPNPEETGACRWFTRDQIDALPETEFSKFSKKILNLCDECKEHKWDKIEIISFTRKNLVYCLQNRN